MANPTNKAVQTVNDGAPAAVTTPNVQALLDKIAQLEAAAVAARGTADFRLAVGGKDGAKYAAVYTCGSRFPLAIHPDQWAIVKANIDAIDAYMTAHGDELATMRGILAAYRNRSK